MKRSASLFLFFLLLVALIYSCNNSRNQSTHGGTLADSVARGKELAIKFCQSCHVLPDPSLLDKQSWAKGVLPNMGPRLGIFEFFQVYPSSRNDKSLPSNFYPSAPMLNADEWQSVIDYYTTTAPDTLPAQQRPQPIQMGLPLFAVEKSKYDYGTAISCYVKIDTGQKALPIMVSDAARKKLYSFNKQLQVQDSINCSSPVVNMDFANSQMLACEIGILTPNNGKHGEGVFLEGSGEKNQEADRPLFDSLMRPVQITSADFNNDGQVDYLVCEFGNLIGQLSWMENLGGGKFTKHVLRPTPGAIKAYVNDYNHDGLPDIWVLFAQGEEGIFLFTNKGNGEFKTEEVLRFPPSYGSSYFELADFNKDGYPDIVYTCGDNADFSTVLKPYHGVYIFLNDHSNHFTQKYFFPINGCYKAIARDFDGDGDLDIATISFFADYAHQPEEGFVYLENKGNFDFMPYSMPMAKQGRWLTMDAGDYNGDGKLDLVLGNFSAGPSFIKSSIDWKQSPPFIVLRNTGRTK